MSSTPITVTTVVATNSSASRPSTASPRDKVSMLSLVNSLPDIRPRVSRNEKFHKAIQDDNSSEVTALLAFSSHSTTIFERIDVNERDSFGMTALHYACAHGNLEIVDELLHHGALPSINARDEDGSTPLHYACQHAHLQIVRQLLSVSDQAKANSVATAPTSTSSSSTIDNTTDKKKGTGRINVNAATKAGLTPIIRLAASSPPTIAHVPIIAQLLYEHNAKVNHASKAGITALHAAVLASNILMVDWLLSHGADVNALTSEGKSALDFALLDATPKQEMAAFLMSYNGNANQPSAKALIDSAAMARAQALSHARRASLELAQAHQTKVTAQEQLSHRAQRMEQIQSDVKSQLDQTVAEQLHKSTALEESKEATPPMPQAAAQQPQLEEEEEEEEQDDSAVLPQEETEEEKQARLEFRKKIFERWQEEHPGSTEAE